MWELGQVFGHVCRAFLPRSLMPSAMPYFTRQHLLRYLKPRLGGAIFRSWARHSAQSSEYIDNNIFSVIRYSVCTCPREKKKCPTSGVWHVGFNSLRTKHRLSPHVCAMFLAAGANQVTRRPPDGRCRFDATKSPLKSSCILFIERR